LRAGDNVTCLPLARARGQLYGDSGWGVDDIERVVDELASQGVVFERYDEGPIITDEKGIATFEKDAKVAYFKDPDGNTLSIAQAPRS
jgi:catechol 2,3-dioxygenase-like lactoylglutathione lyase family enzyme